LIVFDYVKLESEEGIRRRLEMQVVELQERGVVEGQEMVKEVEN